MEFSAIIAAISPWFKRAFRAKGRKVSNTMIQAGMFSRVETTVNITARDVIAYMPDSAVDNVLPPETRVAFHSILTKELSVGTKAGPMRTSLAGKYAEQELTVDHTLAALHQNGVLAHLSDEDS